jgi:hypothetical protein
MRSVYTIGKAALLIFENIAIDDRAWLQNTELFFFAKYSTNKWTDVDAEVLCLTQHTTQQANSARAALHPCGTDRATPPVSTPCLHASARVSHTASLTGRPRLSARTAPHRTAHAAALFHYGSTEPRRHRTVRPLSLALSQTWLVAPPVIPDPGSPFAKWGKHHAGLCRSPAPRPVPHVVLLSRARRNGS